MMKVVLISPYWHIQSLGIRTLSACLKREGYEVRIIFVSSTRFKDRYSFNTRYTESILNNVVELSRGADLIGISLATNDFENAVQLTQRLKKDLSIPIVWGGIHPTMRPDECIEYVDMVCIGEGEQALVKLVTRMNDECDYHDTPGMWFKDKDNIIKNKLRPLNQDLGSIPFPDYDYGNHYILDSESVHKMNEDLLKEQLNKLYGTMATRGCPFRCSYCCNNALNTMYAGQKPVRKRSADNIIQELMAAKRNLPFIEGIVFEDDAFLICTVEEIREFCQKYKENIGLPLTISGATPLTLTRDKLSLLVDAGLVNMRMGIQTASENTKRLYHRHYSNQEVEKAVMTIDKFKDKLYPFYDIILDNPWETDEDLVTTLMLLVKIPTPYTLYCYSLTFYPGTELYRKAKADGVIADELEDVYSKNFREYKNTYLNSLFYLLSTFAPIGIHISPKIMSLLTNRKLRQSKLSWLIMKLNLIIPSRLLVLREAMRHIRKGDWSLIRSYVYRNFLKLLPKC